MNENAKQAPADTGPVQQQIMTGAPLAWHRYRLYGGIGVVYRAEVGFRGRTLKLVIDQPRKGEWVLRGWIGGALFVYRGPVRTLTEMKRIATDIANKQEPMGVEDCNGCDDSSCDAFEPRCAGCGGPDDGHGTSCIQ